MDMNSLQQRKRALKKLMREHQLIDQVKHLIRDYFSELPSSVMDDEIYSELMESIEKVLILETMHHTDYNQIHAKRLLGIARGTLRNRLKNYGLID